MIELARSSVQTWECDQMGHMNVQFYVEKASDAIAAYAAQLGLGPRSLKAGGHTLVPVDQHIRFLRELRPGTPYFLRGGAVAAEPARLTHYCELVQTAGQTVSATFRTVVVLDGAADGFSSPTVAAATSHAIALPEHGQPRGLALQAGRIAPAIAEADALGLLTTFQGVVRPADCDLNGDMAPRAFMARLSDSIPNLLVQTSGSNRGEDRGTGGAALEYRFLYRRRPRAGDILLVRSGLRAIAAKTYIWVHWIFDLETGACVATAEAVAVAMDLATRKAIPLPDELRVRLETLLIADLSV